MALDGINLHRAADPAAAMRLNTVYTALLTQTQDETMLDMPEMMKGMRERERQAVSALELLNKHERFVLLDDSGSGKSAFVNFVAVCMAGELLGDEQINVQLPDDKGVIAKMKRRTRFGKRGRMVDCFRYG